MIIDELEKEQKALHDKIEAALREFTDNTGVRVESMRWTVHTVLNAEGKHLASKYWQICSTLETSYT